MTIGDTVSGAAGALSSTVMDYTNSHHEGVLALFVMGGTIICFAGQTIVQPTVFLLGFVPTFALCSYVGLAVVNDLTSKTTFILETFALIVAAILAIMVGIIMLKVLFRFAIIVICAGLGVVLVLDLNLFIMQSNLGTGAEILRDALVIIAAIFAGACSIRYPETSIILGTAFDGSGIAIYSLAKFLGHRPEVFSVSTTKTGSAEEIAWKLFYASLTLLMGVFGSVMQYRLAMANQIMKRFQENKRPSNADGSVPNGYSNIPDDENESFFPDGEPQTPPFNADEDSGGGYGAVDHEYSVLHNIGAAPLGGYSNLNSTPKRDHNNNSIP